MSLTLLALALALAGLAYVCVSWWSEKQSQMWVKRSNAQCLREFKRIAVHEPRKIIEGGEQ